jgi:hypothetical protein
MPCSVPIFESVGDQEIGESIFVEEKMLIGEMQSQPLRLF